MTSPPLNLLTDAVWEVWMKDPAGLVPGWNVRLDRSFGCFPGIELSWEKASITAWEVSEADVTLVSVYVGSVAVREDEHGRRVISWQLVKVGVFGGDEMLARVEELLDEDEVGDERALVRRAAREVVEWLRTKPRRIES